MVSERSRPGFGPLRISFDLDETLTCHGAMVPRERGFLAAVSLWWFGEPLRQGTRSLITQLRRKGWRIWIYTTSSRPPWRIRQWLLLHGIHVHGIVNSERHRSTSGLRCLRSAPSKFPPAFGIDLHVDDSEGVRMEGQAYGFRVVQVDPHDPCWIDRVLQAVDDIGRGWPVAAEHPQRQTVPDPGRPIDGRYAITCPGSAECGPT